jgi:single-stranded-DNA-specific exonuclease
MSRTRWRLHSSAPDDYRALFPELNPLIVQILWNRGLKTQGEVDEFLLPDYGQDLHDPFLFRDMEKSCRAVFACLERGEGIAVYGDYDADGVCSSAIMITALKSIAAAIGSASRIDCRIPHREKEGYGVRPEGVREIARGGSRLMITVDCGIGSADEVDLAKSLGMGCVVVDHHDVPTRVPDCPTLHPFTPGETYPFKHLAAAGVAFKFACGLVKYAEGRGIRLAPGFDKWLLDLVAIATVTDCMPLIGENRTLEKYGLIVLNKTRRPGLRRLVERAGLQFGKIDTYSIGFVIGPRINAASRMDHAKLALDTVMSDEEHADEAAARLDGLNSDRQKLTEDIYALALQSVSAAGAAKALVVAGDGWPAGIVGLIAGKLVSDLGTPAFVFGREGARYVGSGRSIPGFNLMEALETAKPHLARCGGHPQACGLTVDGEGNFLAFTRAVQSHAESVLGGAELKPTLFLDAEMRPTQADWDLVENVGRLEPFGEGNRKPRFLMRDLEVTGIGRVGRDGRHLRLSIHGDSPREQRLIGFGLADETKWLGIGTWIDAAVEVGINEWNGSREIQLKMIDIRPSEVTE